MIRTTEITITPAGEPIFSERGYTVKINDEGAGEFIVVRENADALNGAIRVDLEDWLELRDAIDQMVSGAQEYAANAPQRQ